MNHIYKSIFNKALGVFTAVPEFASAHGKGSERTVVGRVAKGTAGFAASALAISVGLALTSTNAVASAGIYVNDGTDPGCLALPDTPYPNTGIYGISSSGNSIVPGNSIINPGYTLVPNSYFGLDQMKPCLPSGDGVHAAATQTNRTLFYGNTHTVDTTNNGSKNLTLGGRLDVNSGIIGVGDRGTNGAGATNSIRMGTGTTLDETNKHTNAIAIGVNTATTAEGAVAISAEAKARTSYSIAIGRNATAGGDMVPPSNETGGAIAIGRNSLSNYIGAIALGNGAEVSSAKPDGKTTDGIAIGTKALVDNYRGMAIGAQSQAKGSQSIVLANNAPDAKVSVASGIRSQVYGVESEASGTDAVAIGYKNTVAAHRTYAIGNEINVAKEAEEALAFGTRAHVSGAYQISLGSDAGADAVAANTSGIAIGRNAGRYGQSGILNTAIGAASGQYVSGSYNIAMGTGAGSGTDAEKLAASQTISIGHNAKASKHTAIAMGTTAQARTEKSVALGENAIAGDTAAPTVKKGEYSTAIGSNTTALGYGATAVGSITKAKVNYATALGHEAEASGSGETSLGYGAGANSTSPNGNRNGVNVGTNAGRYAISGGNNVAVGISAGQYVEGDNNIAQGYSAGYYIKGNENVSIGTNANLGSATEKLEVSKTVAIGSAAKTSASNAIAMGNTAQSKTTHSIAIGQNASAGDDSANAEQKGVSAVAIGHGAQANYYDAIAIGARATVAPAAGNTTAADSIAIGVEATADNYKTTAIGTYARAKGRQSTVIANNVQGSNYSTASGDRSQVYGVETTVSGNNSVAIGDTNNVASARTYVMGNNINAAAGTNDSLAFGTKAGVGGANAIALGNTAKATKENTIAQGTESVVYGKNSVSIGYKAVSGIETPTPTQTNAFSVSIGNETEAIDASTIAIGDKAKAKGGVDALAVGTQANAMTYKALAIGAYSQATGRQSTVIGNDIQGQPSIASGTRSQILGVQSNVSGDNSVSIGDTNTIASARTYALGNNINVAAGADDSLVFGTKAAVGAENTVAIGTNANAAQANSVALGAGSTTSDVHTGDYTLNGSYTAAGLPKVANGTVSVGAVGKERQIQNVAAGVISATSTDAINGSQLYATNNYLSNLAGGVKNVLGGDAAVDNADNLTMSDVGGTGKGNVHEAIAAVKGVADTAVQEVESENPTALSVKKDGTKVTLTPNFITGDLVNADGTVNAPATADEGKLVSAKTVADALKANHFVVDTKGNTETGSEADAKVGSGNKVTFEAGNNLVAKQANTANGGATVKFSLKDDISLNSVTAGTGANQVVLGNDGVKVGGNTYINNDGLNANSKVISNVADGVNPNDAVNKSQLDAVKGVADSAVKSVDTVASEENLVVDNNDPQNPKLRLKKAVNLTSIKLDGATPGNTTYVSGYGLTIEDGPSVKKEGINAGDKKITNVAAGDVSATSKDAVNGGQLHNVATSVANVLGGNAAVDGNGNVTSSDIGGTGANTVDDAIKAVNATAAKHTTVVEGKNVKVTKGKNAAGGDEYTVATKDDLDVTSVTAGNTTVNTNGLTITGGPSVTRGGIDAGNAVITNVRDGKVEANSKDAVNGGQLHATNTKLDGVKAKADTAVQDVKSGDENALTAVKDPSTNIVTVTPKLSGDLVDANGNITAPTTPAEKGKLVTAGTVAQALANTHFVVDTKATDGELDAASQADQKIKAGNKVTLQAGKNLKAKQTNGANGAQVEFSLKDSISLTQVTAGEGDNQVVLGNNGVQVGGNTYINKDGLNANSKVISNVADGVNPNDAVNKGQLDAVKGVADSAVKSVDVANGEQNLVVDNTDPKNPKLSLKKDLTVDSVKAGDSTLNTDGLTIAGGPSVKKDGINAGNKKITGVADGNVAAGSTDAVNGGQLYNVANNVKDLIGPDAAIDPATGKVTVTDPAKGIGETGKGNIGDAIKHVNDAAKAAADTAKKHTTVEQGDNIVVEESLNADGGKHYKVSTTKNLNVDSVKAGDTTVNNDGVTINNGPSMTKDGINANNKVISNVADGVNTNDAVNKGQLDAVKGVADSAVKSVNVANGEENLVVDNTDAKNPKLSLKKDLTVDSVKAGDTTVNNDGLTIAGGPSVKKDGIDAADKKITNVEAGNVAENSKDAVNGGQLYDVAKNVADLVGPDAKIDPATGKVTVADPAKGIGETGKGNIGDAIKHVNDAVKAAADTAKKHTTVEQGDNIVVEESLNADGGKHYKVSTAKNLNVDSVKAGDTTVNNDGVTINNGPSMTKDGINANNTKVTNVADGVDAADAVNKGQLDKVDTKVSNVAQNVVNVLGGDATVNGNGDITMSNIGETGKGNINDAIKSVNDLAKKAAAEKTSVKAKEGRSNVTVTEGVNAAGGHEYTVDVERSVTNAGSDYVTVTNNHDADTNTTTYTVDVSAKTKASLAKADSAVQGLTSKDGNLNFTKGANGNVEVSFNDNLNVKNVTTDRVQVANGPSMSKDGINAAGKAISNVANGNVAADSKDAVNGGQLHETAKSVADVIGGGATVKDGKVVAGQNGIGNTGQNTVHGAIAAINQNTANNFNQIRGDLRKMDRDLRGGIAGALATAGLPQAFRPGKSMVAAAASTYRGQSGLAIGVSRISDNGKVILKVTGNTNSRGDFGGTIGAGYQW